MQPFALPRTSSRRVRHIAIRSHFNQPATHARLHVSPFRIDYAGILRAVVIASPLVVALSVAVFS